MLRLPRNLRGAGKYLCTSPSSPSVIPNSNQISLIMEMLQQTHVERSVTQRKMFYSFSKQTSKFLIATCLLIIPTIERTLYKDR